MSTLITDKVENAAVQKKLDTSAYLPHTPAAILLVCCLFALWGWRAT